jgi:NADPH-dependent curcumin reductase CurA
VTVTTAAVVATGTTGPHGRSLEVTRVSLPEPGPGEVLVRNDAFAVDAITRSRLAGDPFLPGFGDGEVLTGPAVGTVVRSHSERVVEGAAVLHDLGWRRYAVLPETAIRVPSSRSGVPARSHLGILGTPGHLAHTGLAELGVHGGTVYVSAAAGALGSAFCQLARVAGARVVASAGTEEKLRFLTEELGVHAAKNHRTGSVADWLGEVAPDGVDVFVDGVGGPDRSAVLEHVRPRGQVLLCGEVASYGTGAAAATTGSLMPAVARGLLLVGIGRLDLAASRVSFADQVGAWVADGTVHNPETVYHGLEQAELALDDMFRGATRGRTVVALG